MVRWDTYDVDEEPPHRTFDAAMERKVALKHEGFRVKIRKNNDGLFVVFKKNDKLFHGTDWRSENNG